MLVKLASEGNTDFDRETREGYYQAATEELSSNSELAYGLLEEFARDPVLQGGFTEALYLNLMGNAFPSDQRVARIIQEELRSPHASDVAEKRHALLFAAALKSFRGGPKEKVLSFRDEVISINPALALTTLELVGAYFPDIKQVE
jgi:hypothetical protein